MAKASLFEQRRHDGQMDMAIVPAVAPRAGEARKPRPVQLPCDIGLFSDDAEQLDLVSWITEQSEQ